MNKIIIREVYRNAQQKPVNVKLMILNNDDITIAEIVVPFSLFARREQEPIEVGRQVKLTCLY